MSESPGNTEPEGGPHSRPVAYESRDRHHMIHFDGVCRSQRERRYPELPHVVHSNLAETVEWVMYRVTHDRESG